MSNVAKEQLSATMVSIGEPRVTIPEYRKACRTLMDAAWHYREALASGAFSIDDACRYRGIMGGLNAMMEELAEYAEGKGLPA